MVFSLDKYICQFHLMFITLGYIENTKVYYISQLVCLDEEYLIYLFVSVYNNRDF